MVSAPAVMFVSVQDDTSYDYATYDIWPGIVMPVMTPVVSGMPSRMTMNMPSTTMCTMAYFQNCLTCFRFKLGLYDMHRCCER